MKNKNKKEVSCNFVGFCCGVVNVSVLLEWGAASLSNWCPRYQGNLPVLPQRVKQSKKIFFFDYLTLQDDGYIPSKHEE
jgi:hypothetical protein